MIKYIILSCLFYLLFLGAGFITGVEYTKIADDICRSSDNS